MVAQKGFSRGPLSHEDGELSLQQTARPIMAARLTWQGGQAQPNPEAQGPGALRTHRHTHCLREISCSDLCALKPTF